MLHISELELIEDVFSTVDVKKYNLFKREAITETNSDYIIANDLSRKILATNFVNNLNIIDISLEYFNETLKTSIANLFDKLLT